MSRRSSVSPQRRRKADSTSASPSPSQSPLLAEGEMDLLDRYSSTTASPRSFSPVTFMTDSDRSGLTTPRPSSPRCAADDTGASASEIGQQPPLVDSLHNSPILREQTESEMRVFNRNSKTGQEPSALSFRSSLFSFTTKYSTSTGFAEEQETAGSASSTSSPSPFSSPATTESEESAAETVTPTNSSSSSVRTSRVIADSQDNLLPSSSSSTLSSPVQNTCAPASYSKISELRCTAEKAELRPPNAKPSTPATQELPHHTKTEISRNNKRKQAGPAESTSRTRDVLATEKQQTASLTRPLNGPEELDTVSTLPTSSLEEKPATAAPPPHFDVCGSPSSAVDHLPEHSATLADTHAWRSLSQLASNLLNGETSPVGDQPAMKSRISAAELSWVPRPLPRSAAKRQRRKAVSRTSSPAVAKPGDTSALVDDEATVKRVSSPQRKKAGRRTAMSSAAASKAPEGDVAKDRHLEGRALKNNARKFDVDDWPLSVLFGVHNGNTNVSRLSQLSFWVSEDAAEMDGEVGAPPPQKEGGDRKRKNHKRMRAGASEPRSQDRPPSKADAANGGGACADEADGQSFVLTPSPVFLTESSEVGELRTESAWRVKQSCRDGVQPSLMASASPPRRQRQREKQAPTSPAASCSDKPLSQSKVAVPAKATPDPLAWWTATCAAAAPSSSAASRPCLWVELSERYQETHGALLRRLLVYWGCVHQEKVKQAGTLTGESSFPKASSSSSLLSTAPSSRRKRPRADRKADVPPAQSTASPPSHPSDRQSGCDGLVMLLCPLSVPLAEALQWWTQRAHAAHAFMPPLLAVSMTADAAAAAPSANVHDGLLAVDSSASEASTAWLLSRAVLHAACSTQMDPNRSLAVSCSEAGMTAFAQILPRVQVYTSLDACANMLATLLNFPSIDPDAEVAANGLSKADEAVDVGSVAAVLATTAYSSGGPLQFVADKAVEVRQPRSLQDRCFEELCRWNGLAARLRGRPRRPQLLLRRECVDTPSVQLRRLDGESSPNTGTNKTFLSTSVGSPATVTAPLPRLWVSYGLVRPATCNEDTFADTARREARLLASHAPPVTLLPSHMFALSLFASTLFTHDNYATAVNLIDANARRSPPGLTDYVSGYSCVITGPLRYAVSATMRRYLHVRLSMNVTPLLALVNDSLLKPTVGAGEDETWKSAKAAAASAAQAKEEEDRPAAANSAAAPSTAALMMQTVVHLARSQWRSVVDSCSCTCTPGILEQVTHTEDGWKVCRHLAELFYYFLKQQFRVVVSGPRDATWAVAREAYEQARRSERARERERPTAFLSAPTPTDHRPAVLGSSPSVCPSMQRTRAFPSDNESSDSENSGTGGDNSPLREEADAAEDHVPLSMLYALSASVCASRKELGEAEGLTTRDGVSLGEVVSNDFNQAPTSVFADGASAATSRRKKRKAEGANATGAPTESKHAAEQPSPPLSSLPSPAPSPPPTPAANFHTEALQYALQYIWQRRVGGETTRVPAGPQPSTASSPVGDASLAKEENDPSSSARQERSCEEKAAEKSAEEEARALQLVEQLLRSALR